MALLDELAAFAITQGLATALGTDLFLDEQPNDPTVSMTFIMGGGTAPTVNTPVSYPTLQVLTKDPDGQSGRSRAMAAATALTGILEQNIGDVHVMMIEALQSAPVRITPDDEGNRIFSQNFKMTIRGSF